MRVTFMISSKKLKQNENKGNKKEVIETKRRKKKKENRAPSLELLVAIDSPSIIQFLVNIKINILHEADILCTSS